MTTVLRGSNKKGIDQLMQIAKDWIFPNIGDADRERIMEHFDWMRVQTNNMSVNCRLETQEATQVTRIVLEVSFHQLPPWQRRNA